MIGDFVRRLESHWFEDECVIDGNIWYQVMHVDDEGVAWGVPAAVVEIRPQDYRLFYLCTNEVTFK